MMKKFLAVLAVLLIASAAAQAQVVFSENFNAPLSTSVWQQFGGDLSGPRYDALLPVVTDPADPTNTVGEVPTGTFTGPEGTSYAQMRHNLGGSYATGYEWTVRLWLPGTTTVPNNLRSYFQAISYNSAMSAQQIIGIGVYNTGVSETQFQARISASGVAPYAAWFNLPVDRKPGWHTLGMKFGNGTVDFLVDGNAVVTGAARGNFDLNYVAVGFGGQSVVGPMYWDDITIAAVPEPSSLAALASGIFGMAGFAIRRRRS